MKVLLDEGVPRQLIPALRVHGGIALPFPNDWKGLKNGRLLERMEQEGFDCLVTCDKNLEWQQPLQSRQVALLVLPVQKLADLLLISEVIVAALSSLGPGEVRHVRGAGRGATEG